MEYLTPAVEVAAFLVDPLLGLGVAAGLGGADIYQKSQTLNDRHASKKDKRAAKIGIGIEAGGIALNAATVGVFGAIESLGASLVGEGAEAAAQAAVGEGVEQVAAQQAVETAQEAATAAVGEGVEVTVQEAEEKAALLGTSEDFLSDGTLPTTYGFEALSTVELGGAEASELAGLLGDSAEAAEASIRRPLGQRLLDYGKSKLGEKLIHTGIISTADALEIANEVDEEDVDPRAPRPNPVEEIKDEIDEIKDNVRAGVHYAVGGGLAQDVGSHGENIASKVLGGMFSFNKGRVVQDSNLPDQVIFDVMKRNDSGLHTSQHLFAQDRIRPDVLYVRGTGNVREWIANVTGADNQRLLREQTAQIVEHVKKHPEVRHIIGHSRGAAAAHDAAHLTGRMFCGIDGAMILCRAPGGIRARNINKTGGFDRVLDPVGPIEREADGSEQGMSQRMHHAELGKYTQEVMGKMGNIPGEDLATGFERGGPSVRSVSGNFQGSSTNTTFQTLPERVKSRVDKVASRVQSRVDKVASRVGGVLKRGRDLLSKAKMFSRAFNKKRRAAM